MTDSPHAIRFECLACSSRTGRFRFPSRDYITGDDFSVWRCSECGASRTLPTPSVAEISRYYADSYYGQRKSITERLINRSRFRLLSALTRGEARRLLDVGCGNGSVIAELLRRGWDAYGTEVAPSDHIAEEVRGRIRSEFLPQCDFPSGHFDLVTMWHTLEHFPDPARYVGEAGRLLPRGGILVVEVPNADSWQARVAKDDWFHLDVPRHITHFTPASVTAMLERAGFKVRTISHQSFIYGIFGFWQSMLNRITRRKNLSFDFLNGKLERGWWRSNVRDILTHFILGAPLFLIAVFGSLLENIMRKGGVITIVAEKP